LSRIIFNKHSIKSKGKRKLKFSSLIIFFCFLSFTAAAILIGATGYGIAPPSIYDKHIKEDTSQLSQQERFKKDFDFLYKEIKNNYVNLEYKEKTFNFSWDKLYERYRSSIENAKNEKEFYMKYNTTIFSKLYG
jgi:hypothetical protein